MDSEKVRLVDFDEDLRGADGVKVAKIVLRLLMSAKLSVQLPEMKAQIGEEASKTASSTLQGMQIQLMATLSKAGLATLEELAQGQDVPPELVRLVQAVAQDPNSAASKLTARYRTPDKGEEDAIN